MKPITHNLPGNLPVQDTPFVGRVEDLAWIAASFAERDCRLITLVGPGGIGKTRLACQAALETVRARGFGGAYVTRIAR